MTVSRRRIRPRQARNSSSPNASGSWSSEAEVIASSSIVDIVKYLSDTCECEIYRQADQGGREMQTLSAKVLEQHEGFRLQSGPGRDLVFKVTGDDTGGAFDYFIVEVAPHGGPPLHVHHVQEETIHVLNGRFKVRIGEETFELAEGGF